MEWASYFSPWNLNYLESLTSVYRNDPDGLDDTWRAFFDGVRVGLSSVDGTAAAANVAGAVGTVDDFPFELKVDELIEAYRELGYLIADVNPLAPTPDTHPLLDLPRFGLTPADLDRPTRFGERYGLERPKLRQLVEVLKDLYGAPLAVEYAHIHDPEAREWIEARVGRELAGESLSVEAQKRIFQKLSEAEGFETFIHRKFVGQKRFSIEGCDALVPMLDFLIEKASSEGADEIVLGMAHRGRLNVMANVWHRDMSHLLAEFAGHLASDVSDGDVKYHLGHSQDLEMRSGKKIHLSLLPNPSHLESVDPVLLGVVRAKQKLKGDQEERRIVPVLIHGDAAFSGQGVVYEVLNFSEIDHYSVGGTIHIVLNNQIGYTTTPKEGRSSPYATDVTKMLQIPAIRVNADHPEAAVRAILMAFDYRNRFKRDVVVDLIGYRRYGHNEGDEPGYTQPVLYAQIEKHLRVREIYGRKLIRGNVLTETEEKEPIQTYQKRMEEIYESGRDKRISVGMSAFGDRWKGLQAPTEESVFKSVDTSVPLDRLKAYVTRIRSVPEGFHLHPKLRRAFQQYEAAARGEADLDWAMGELLCYASLLAEGHPVRLAGQDSVRGTFSHRHAAYYDIETGEVYNPLNHLDGRQAEIEVINSPLSEYGVLGFEMGQSWAAPNQLTIWEAQFGDFMNGAQIILDQFLSAAARKWQRHSGLVLLLPHGYEGQGPEHSSARLERFLQLSAQLNLQVANFTTPAQLFHALRRQLLRPFRIPLVIMSPKSLLRNPRVVSPLRHLAEGRFHEVLDDPNAEVLRSGAKKIVLCSGKIYYELLEARGEKSDTAIVRIEQLYPFPADMIGEVLRQYGKAKRYVWCQEEPENMGAWLFVQDKFRTELGGKFSLDYVGRKAMASPAEAYRHLHEQEQQRIVQTALK